MAFTARRISGRCIAPVTSFATTPGRGTPEKYLETLFRPDSIISSWAPLTNDAIILPNDCWKHVFDIELPEGRCVGVELMHPGPDHPDSLSPENIARSSHWIHAMLHPQEVAFGVSQPKEHARDSFFVGRLAMREALRLEQNSAHASILKDQHGRPIVPRGYLGSISHKRNVGVALVTTTSTTSDESETVEGVGIDIEQTLTKRDIAKKVLTPTEISELGKVEGVTIEEEVLLRFSMKESLYKAMHPILCQYVGFQEAEVTPYPDGTASVEWNIENGRHDMFQDVSVHWRRMGEYFLTSARICVLDDGCDAIEALSRAEATLNHHQNSQAQQPNHQ